MTLPSRKRVLLEVPVASAEDALAAQAGGADRLELNAALALGGLTPSLGTLIEVRAAVRLPLLVMVRPRSGGFAYSAADFRVMQRDADLALQERQAASDREETCSPARTAYNRDCRTRRPLGRRQESGPDFSNPRSHP